MPSSFLSVSKAISEVLICMKHLGGCEVLNHIPCEPSISLELRFFLTIQISEHSQTHPKPRYIGIILQNWFCLFALIQVNRAPHDNRWGFPHQPYNHRETRQGLKVFGFAGAVVIQPTRSSEIMAKTTLVGFLTWATLYWLVVFGRMLTIASWDPYCNWVATIN